MTSLAARAQTTSFAKSVLAARSTGVATSVMSILATNTTQSTQATLVVTTTASASASADNSANTNNAPSSSSNTGLIVGIVVALVLAAIFIAIYLHMKKCGRVGVPNWLPKLKRRDSDMEDAGAPNIATKGATALVSNNATLDPMNIMNPPAKVTLESLEMLNNADTLERQQGIIMMQPMDDAALGLEIVGSGTTAEAKVAGPFQPVPPMGPPSSGMAATATLPPPVTTAALPATTAPTTTSAAAKVTTAPAALTTLAALTTQTDAAATTTSSAAAVAAPPTSVNWTLIGGVAGGVVACILLIGAISFFTKANRESRRRKNPDNFDQLYHSGSGPVTAPRAQKSPVENTPRRDTRSSPNPEPVYESYAMKSAAAAPSSIHSGGEQVQYMQPQQYNSVAPAVVVIAQPYEQERQQYLQQQQQQYNSVAPASAQQYDQQYYLQQQQQQQYQQQAAYAQYYQQQNPNVSVVGYPSPVGAAPAAGGANGQPDYTAQWQQYFAENPGAYEAYMAQQQEAATAAAAASGSVEATAYTHEYTSEEPTHATSVATAAAPKQLNAADFETYEEFVEAQNALSLAAVELAHSSAVGASVPVQSAQDVEFEDRMRQKLAKETQYIAAHNASKKEEEEGVPAYEN
ncbi:hypothetical protein HDU98_006911 [Podochytrium sp. JEL0797]|nr:hypothetical protein HDU98_006911 [Podochytrium sp. JEL0797]